mgnify:CR=1 FL=1
MYFHIIDRETAIERGIDKFFNLKPCRPYKNIYLRNTKTGRCLCEQHKKHNAKRQKINHEKRSQEYKDRQKLISKKWREENKELVKIMKANSKKVKKQVSYNSKERSAKYRKENKVKIAVNGVINRVKRKHPNKIDYELSELDMFVTEQCVELRFLRENLTGIEWNIDHTRPLGSEKLDGRHTWDNLQVIPFYLNIMKRNRDIFTKPHQWFNYG